MELLRRIILACSKPGETVLDPFLGSGTTSAVAKMLGRNSVGIEKDRRYEPIIRKRLNPPQRTIGESYIGTELI